jgi:murein DD-endopeptidase MepM/ murein hydrolase activator NlpD
MNAKRLMFPLLMLLISALACQQGAPEAPPPWNASQHASPFPTTIPTADIYLPLTSRNPDQPRVSPTPDAPHPVPKIRTEAIEYTIQSGDTLGQVSRAYGISLDDLIAANEDINPNLLSIGQVINIPPPNPDTRAPSFKVIPDSELVYGPASALFDVTDFVKKQNGYLARYQQENITDLDGVTLNGAQIVQRVAQQYSVNPRLLLAVLEYQSGWVTNAAEPAGEDAKDYPVGISEEMRKGLYRQLAWAANLLNRGYYLWRVSGANSWVLADGTVIPVEATINAGTAGVQQLFAPLYGKDGWLQAITAEGVFATYNRLFGYPFDIAIEPLVPAGIRQPKMQLPFEPGVVWAFTGGPHGGWADGSAWAALDFAPGVEALGCAVSDAWVTAAANGPIVRAGNGEVIQDIDGGGVNNDGYEQTGWVLLYMHISGIERIQTGTYLNMGDRIGHPSCEGGFSTGTHLHIARRYNGEWIPADQTLPFVMDEWVSRGLGNEYDGLLVKDDDQIEAWNGVSPANSIQR